MTVSIGFSAPECDENLDKYSNPVMFNTWNFFSDLARTLNEKFIGDLDEKQILKIYDKLFYGCNLEVINEGKEKYSPCFDDDERKKIILILKNGLSILDRGDLRHAQ